MRKPPTLVARAAAALTTVAVTLSGAMVLTAAPAQAKRITTDFAFQTTAYGTSVTAKQIDLRSGRTAFSYISCTRQTGINRDIRQDDLATVNGNDMIQVKGIESKNSTYRIASKRIVGVQGTNTIAHLEIGGAEGPKLLIRGLTTQAKAWHRGNGLHTSTMIDSLPVVLTLDGQNPAAGTPLDDLRDQADEGISGVFDALGENGGQIQIPGLGTLHSGYERNTVKSSWAAASTYALRVTLDNGSTVAIGRAWAKISRDVPAGVFTGLGYGSQVDMLDGAVKVGRLATQPLPCVGTDGKIRRNDLAGLDVGALDAVKLSALTGRSFGVQHNDGRARGWTEGRVAGVTLGTGDARIVIRGIVGRAGVHQTSSGALHKSAEGTRIGSLTVGGQTKSLPDPGQALKVPGVALIETKLISRTRRGISVTAVKITLLNATSGIGVIKLGNANVRLKRN